MRQAFRVTALALGLMAGATLISSPPAEARSVQRDGYFGGSWAPIGPRHNRYVQRHYRRYGPDYYGNYGPGYGPDYYYGPSYYFGPGIGIGLAF
jgi:hypothetical protein